MKKIAVILSGNGVYDGAEIHEATMSLYAIMSQGGEYKIFAPDMDQHHVINHLTGDEMNEKRNVLIESARIARGEIAPLTALSINEFDALILPGGFGVAKNLSDFAFKGNQCHVLPELENIIKETVKKRKPIGALCISPAIIARILDNVRVTVGNDKDTINAIEDMGGEHQITSHGEVVVDHKYKIATTPCYMLDANILDIANGAKNVVKAVFDLID